MNSSYTYYNCVTMNNSTSSNNFLLDKYFKNLAFELHVDYVYNTHTKFCINWILFTISS